MPIHEYDCAACGERIEVWTRRLDETPAVRCARCGSERMTRRISAPAVLRGGPAPGTPAPGELRAADGRALTRDVAARYAERTGDAAIREVAREAERGTEPAKLQELVRGVKEERKPRAAKRRGAP
ncbi:MAG: hypothetical protein A2X23_06695 [Chloroflexi bacterium GWC2_73_18]|nr:MAG: hypothetical protein A2X23_06695 [Chloroflexi bacterium GWC2_73_18]